MKVTNPAETMVTTPESAERGAEMAIVELALADLEPDPFQPRKEFNESKIRELAGSIEQHGLMQPLIVRPRQGPGSKGKYWIVAGERRYRAAQLLGYKQLPCRVQPYLNVTAAVVALVENVHREDLSDVDKAEGLRRIKGMTDKTWDEVAELVRLSPEYVRRLAGLVTLEESVKAQVRQGLISARTAIALKPLPPRQQVEMAQRAISEGLSAEDIREEVRRSANAGNSRPASKRTQRPPLADFPTAPPDTAPAEAHAPTEVETSKAAREGTVTHTLQTIIASLDTMGDWLDERKLTPGKLTPEQKELVHQLYHAASQFQQRVAYIRQPLKEAASPATSENDKSRLPF